MDALALVDRYQDSNYLDIIYGLILFGEHDDGQALQAGLKMLSGGDVV